MAKDIIQTIEENLKKMSKSHKKIAQFILKNSDKVSFMTASRLGKTVGVSESTVVRFAGCIGFDGYIDFQKSLRQVVQARLTSLQRLELAANRMNEAVVLEKIVKADISNMKFMLENIDMDIFRDVIKILKTSKKVYILGLRSSAVLSSFLAHYLNYLLNDVVLVIPNFSDALEHIIKISGDDCLVAISFPRYSLATLEAMRLAREKGAEIIGITDSMSSPLVEFSDRALFARSTLAALADSLVAPLSLINAIIAYLSLEADLDIQKDFQRLEEIWGERNTYSKDSL